MKLSSLILTSILSVGVAEQVDAKDLKSFDVHHHVGSIPIAHTSSSNQFPVCNMIVSGHDWGWRIEFEHENAHCWGWPGDHPNGIALNGINGVIPPVAFQIKTLGVYPNIKFLDDKRKASYETALIYCNGRSACQWDDETITKGQTK